MIATQTVNHKPKDYYMYIMTITSMLSLSVSALYLVCLQFTKTHQTPIQCFNDIPPRKCGFAWLLW